MNDSIRLRACLALCTIASPCSVAVAQATTDTVSLSPVVITATRVPTAATVSTAATTRLTGAELRARGVTTLLDALRTVPGVSLAQLGGAGSQSSLFLRGGNSNYTKVLIDGVPVNAPGGALDISTLTTDNIDRIEILRGPSSVQYGSDAMSGVVQVFTRRDPGANLMFRAANRDGQYDATAGATGSARLDGSKRLSGTLGGGLHRGDGFLPFNNQYRNATANALGRLTGSRGELAVGATYGDSRYHYPTTGGGVPTDSNAYTGANRLTFSANAAWQPTSLMSARAQLGRADTRSVSDDAPDSPGDTTGFYSRSHGRALRESADLQLVAALPASATLTLGGAVEGQRMRSRGSSRFASFASPPTSFDETRTNRAVYAQASAGRARLAAEAGGRRERLDNGRFVNTGRIGLASEILPGAVVRASVATAFKEPAFDEIFDGPFSSGARNLRPERTRSREAGAEVRIPGGVVTIGATAFDQRFADLVQYQDVDRSVDNTTPNFYNIVAARARGWEFESRAAPIGPLTLHGTYTLLYTEVTNEGNGGFGTIANGKPLLRRPRRSGALDAIYTSRRLALTAVLHRVGARDDYVYGNPDNRARLAPYTLVEASAEVPLRVATPGGGWNVALIARGENLTNSSYENVYGFETPRRVVFIGVRLHD